MNNSECPTDSQLLAIEAGDETNSQLQSHVDGCDWCQQRTAQFQSSLTRLQRPATNWIHTRRKFSCPRRTLAALMAHRIPKRVDLPKEDRGDYPTVAISWSMLFSVTASSTNDRSSSGPSSTSSFKSAAR